MARSMEFYFDFSSPYGYLASTRVEAIARKHDIDLVWRPFLLGVAFKVTGAAPLSTIPMKDRYYLHDTARRARCLGVPLRYPEQFPFGTVSACRAFYFLQRRNPEQAVVLAKALFHAGFVEGRDLSPVEAVAAVAAEAGFDGDEVLAGAQSAEARAILKETVDEALRRGVFGSPFFFVGDEPFWGDDRLEEIDRWLAQGGW